MKRVLSLLFKLLLISLLSLTASCGDEGDDSEKEKGNVETADDDAPVGDADIDPGEDDGEIAQKKNRIAIDVKGIINSKENFKSQKLTYGVGEYDLVIDGEKVEFGGSPYIYHNRYESKDAGELYDKDLLLINVMSDKPEKGTMENGNYYDSFDLLNAGFTMETLKKMEKNSATIDLPETSWFYITNVKRVLRKDKKLFFRYCKRLLQDKDGGNSKLSYDFSENKTFAPGENLKVKMEIDLLDPIPVEELAASEDGCTYYSDGKKLTKAEYTAETAKNGNEMGCDIPEDFLNPFKESNYGLFSITGKINGENEVDPVDSEGELSLFLKDGRVDVSSYKVYTKLDVNKKDGKMEVGLNGLGNVKFIDQKNFHYTVNFFGLFIKKEEIQKLKESGKNILQGKDKFYAQMSEMEHFKNEGKTYVKMCYKALGDFENENSKLFICHKDNSGFDEGEQLRAVGIFSVTDDPETLNKFAASEEDGYETCVCMKDSERISCGDWAAKKKDLP